MADAGYQPPVASYQPAFTSGTSYVHGNPLTALLPPGFVVSNYLAGLPLTATITGATLEGIVQQKIDAAVGEFETKMGTFVVKRKILANVANYPPSVVINTNYDATTGGYATTRPAVAGVDYDMLEVPYDYTARRFEAWALTKVRHRPIVSVESIVYALPPNFGILVVPTPWITFDPNSGIVRIVPVEGAMAVTSPGAGMWLPFFTLGSMTQIPQFQAISYTAGVDPIPADMIDAIAQLAAAKVLRIYNAAFYPGVQSFSHNVDGFNQSVSLRNGGPFTDQIKMFEAYAADYIKSWRSAHNGIRASSLGR